MTVAENDAINDAMTHSLFVVGSDSPNPADWSVWAEVKLVVATSPDEARALCDPHNPAAPVAMIPFDRSQLLVDVPSPKWGADT